MSKWMIAVLMVALVAGSSLAGSWTEKIEVKGDVRIRHEYVDDETEPDARTRQRVRARIGAYAKVNDQVKAGIRAASGSSDPLSTNQTFDDAFSSKGLMLDLAYVDWSPAEGLSLIGGKMKKPFICVSDLVWDGDLNPEGLAAKFKAKGETGTFMANGGCFWLDEVSGSEDLDRFLYTGQVALKTKADEVSILVGAGIYSYDNMMGFEPLVEADSGFGNTIVGVGEEGEEEYTYAHDYNEVEGFVQLKMDANGVPVKLYGQYVVNDDADDCDTGYLGGAKFGKAKEPGSFEVDYNYRDLEKDAVVGAFSDSDFAGGGTDGEGHKFKGKLAIAKNWSLTATYFLNKRKPDSSDTDYDKLRLDLACKF